VNLAQENAKDKESVQIVMQDLLAIRRSINSFQKNKNGQMVESSYQANKILQITALILLVILIGIELGFSDPITRFLIEQNGNLAGRVWPVVGIGIFLIACIVNMYFVVRHSAHRSGENMEAYVKRNFIYLQNLNQCSDLGVKFAVIATIILTGHPNLVGPFLFLFTGDYLFQGRFFTLSIRSSQILGMLSLVGAAAQLCLDRVAVLWPMLWFLVVLLASLKYLKVIKRVDD
jgi:hypothetical protein